MSGVLAERYAQAIEVHLGAPVEHLMAIARGIGGAIERDGKLSPIKLEEIARASTQSDACKDPFKDGFLVMTMLQSAGVIEMVFRTKEGKVMTRPEVGAALRNLLENRQDDGSTVMIEPREIPAAPAGPSRARP